MNQTMRGRFCWLLGHGYRSTITAGEPHWLETSYYEPVKVCGSWERRTWNFVRRGEWVPQTALLQYCPHCCRKYSGPTGYITDARLTPAEMDIVAQ